MDSPATHVEEHYRPGALATRLGVHRNTIVRWIRDGAASNGRRGLWPVHHVSRGCTLIPASAVNRMLERTP